MTDNAYLLTGIDHEGCPRECWHPTAQEAISDGEKQMEEDCPYHWLGYAVTYGGKIIKETCFRKIAK